MCERVFGRDRISLQTCCGSVNLFPWDLARLSKIWLARLSGTVSPDFTYAIVERGICSGHDYCNNNNDEETTTSIQTIFNMIAWILKLLLLKSTFSLHLLCTAIALRLARFEREQIDEARAQLSWLCSRDPSNLNSSDLAGGTLESLSENLSDGFVAPLFWYVLFGHIGALGYCVVNTLDSRIGHRGKYKWFGKPWPGWMILSILYLLVSLHSSWPFPPSL